MNNQDRKAMAAIEKMVAGYRDITRIQIEPLAGGRWRWSIHEGERESFAAVGTPGETQAMLESTKTLLDMLAGIPPGRHVLTIPQSDN